RGTEEMPRSRLPARTSSRRRGRTTGRSLRRSRRSAGPSCSPAMRCCRRTRSPGLTTAVRAARISKAVDGAEATRRAGLPAIPPCPGLLASSRIRTRWRARARRSSSFLVFQVRKIGGRGDDVLFGCPVAQIDQAAAFAAKRHLGVVEGYVLLTDRALHTQLLGQQRNPLAY